jgi:DNA polymerase-3 subunit delta
MKLQLRDLQTSLARRWFSLFWVSGDDLFLMNQTLKDLTLFAKQRGFEIERESLTSSTFSDRFFALTHAFSLFSSHRCIVLTLEVKDLKFIPLLRGYIASKDPALTVILSTGRLPSSLTSQSEFKEMESLADGFCHIPLWPIERENLAAFLMNQAKRYQLYLDRELAEKMAVLTEGNLFSADQLLEKLSLCPNAGKITEADLIQATEDQTRFELFDLVSAVLVGDLARVWKVWARLQSQKIEPILILWALAKEARLIATLHEKSREVPLHELFKQQKFWEKRAREVKLGLARVSFEQAWDLLQQAAKIDRVIKGVEPGDAILLLGEMVIEMTTGRAELVTVNRAL